MQIGQMERQSVGACGRVRGTALYQAENDYAGLFRDSFSFLKEFPMYQANDYLYGHVIALMGIMGYVMSQLESGKQIHGFQLLEQIEQIEQTILKSSQDKSPDFTQGFIDCVANIRQHGHPSNTD